MTSLQGWAIDSLFPAGALVAVTDDDDPPPADVLARGFDVVLHLNASGAMDDGPVLLSVHWRPGLVAGTDPPPAFWVCRSGHSFARCQGEEEAA